MNPPRVLSKYPLQVRAFLEHHADTGEPSADALARVREQLLARAVNGTPRKVRPPRRWVAPEFVIAAGLLLATLGGRWWFERLRQADPRPVAEADSSEAREIKAVRDSWREGNFAVAALLAQQCVAASCAQLRAELAAAQVLVNRLHELSLDELETLAQLDRRISNGLATPLAAQIVELKALASERASPTTRRSAPDKNAEAEALFEEAQALRRGQALDAAVIRLQRCIKIAPSYFNCYKELGSIYARIAARDSSPVDMERARQHYERFLEFAPPDDAAVPLVRAILDAK